MECSFPIEEVRPRENAKAQLRNPKYCIWISKNAADQILGFIAEWDLGSNLFLEHVGVDQTRRRGGIGSGMIED